MCTIYYINVPPSFYVGWLSFRLSFQSWIELSFQAPTSFDIFEECQGVCYNSVVYVCTRVPYYIRAYSDNITTHNYLGKGSIYITDTRVVSPELAPKRLALYVYSEISLNTSDKTKAPQ